MAANLTVGWQQDGQQVIIRQGGVALTVARLVGLPFILAGGYFLKIFWGGLVNDELTGIGWIVIPLLGLAVAFPGWCLMVWRRRATLNNAKREVAEELDFIVFKRRWAQPVTDKSSIRLRYEQGSTSSSKGALTTHSTTHYDIHVDVVTPGKPDTMIGLFDGGQKSEAQALAQKAGAFLGIPVQNKMVEGGTVISGVVVDEKDPEWAAEFAAIDAEDEEEEEKAG